MTLKLFEVGLIDNKGLLVMSFFFLLTLSKISFWSVNYIEVNLILCVEIVKCMLHEKKRCTLKGFSNETEVKKEILYLDDVSILSLHLDDGSLNPLVPDVY